MAAGWLRLTTTSALFTYPSTSPGARPRRVPDDLGVQRLHQGERVLDRHDLRTEEQFPEIAKPESCSKNRRAMIRGQIKPGTHESTRKPWIKGSRAPGQRNHTSAAGGGQYPRDSLEVVSSNRSSL